MYSLTRLSLRFPKTTFVILLAATLALGAGLPRVRTEFGYRVLLGDEHPSIRALDQLIERYGGGLPITIAWECGSAYPCQSVFDESSLAMASAVVRRLAPLQEVRSVDSPATTALLAPASEGFSVRRFIENGVRAPDADQLAPRALEDPLWAGTLVSRDGTVGAIVVQPIDTNSDTELRVVDA